MLLGPYTNEQIEEWASYGWNAYQATAAGPRWADLTEPQKQRQLTIARDMAIHGGPSTPLETTYRDAFLKWNQGEKQASAPPPLAEIKTIKKKPVR